MSDGGITVERWSALSERSAVVLDYSQFDAPSSEPLSAYSSGHAEGCVDHANLMCLLSQSVGLNANTEIVWGGVNSENTRNHKDTGVGHIKAYEGQTLLEDFRYHAYAIVEGTRQDAALVSNNVTFEAVLADWWFGDQKIRVLTKPMGSEINDIENNFEYVETP